MLVRGVGDVGSAVAHALFVHGFRVAIHDAPAPLTTRRGMAFADAMFDGWAVLENVVARRCDALEAIEDLLEAHRSLPVTSLDFRALIDGLRPRVLVDARMRKHAAAEVQRGLAPLTIGLGPNFVAGDSVDLAIETEWGERLGAVIGDGPTAPLRGEPRPLAGHVRDRFVYAARRGRFVTALRVGGRVQAGEIIGRLDGEALRAPLDGWIRGLLHGGVEVLQGTRVAEIDPRLDAAQCFGIPGRPRRIAEGVVAAIAAARSVSANR